MAHQYEVVYIFDSSLEEEQVNAILERFHKTLECPEYPSPITGLSHWGKRTLAYPIRNKELGYYVVAQFETNPSLLDEFERLVKLEESVIRHLVVINEGLATVPASVTVPSKDDEDEDDDGPLVDVEEDD